MYCVASNEKRRLFPMENLEETIRLENSPNLCNHGWLARYITSDTGHCPR